MKSLDARISALEQSRNTGLHQLVAITAAEDAPDRLQVIIEGVAHQSAVGESEWGFADRIAAETGHPRWALLTAAECNL
ncbi:MAG: hypothetical protein QM750_11900 [Rubrivivax sp.]